MFFGFRTFLRKVEFFGQFMFQAIVSTNFLAKPRMLHISMKIAALNLRHQERERERERERKKERERRE